MGASIKLSSLVICSDSELVISLASSDLDPPWEIEAIISDIRSLAFNYGFIFLFVPKSLNVIAHWIVRVAFKCLLLRN